MKSINKELVRQWVDALRSGKYKQGRRALRNVDNEFCCLGVLCDICKHRLNLDWELCVHDTDNHDIYVMDNYGGVLPDKVWDYLGREAADNKVQISITNPKLPSSVVKDYFGSSIFLVTLNDVYRLSFDQIADIIEEEFLK